MHLGMLSGARDEANTLYSAMSDRYQTLLSRGADRVFERDMDNLRGLIQQAAKSFGIRDEAGILSSVKSIHSDVMPRLDRIEESMEKQFKPGQLPPADTADTGVVVPVPDEEVLPPAPGQPGTPSTKVRPWYLNGGVDWRIIGGVGGAMLVLTLLLRRR